MMAETYEHFMVFTLEDTGERIKLDISENEFRVNNGENFLVPSQVYVIVKEDLRRIFIWNGAYSSVRKKFIASRVASDLQNELVTSAHFHHCKIISVDQGNEPYEFLSAFGFKSIEIKNPEIKPQSIEDASLVDNKLIFQWNGPPPELKRSEKNFPILKESQNEIPSASQFEELDNQRGIIDTIISNKVPDNLKRQNLILGNLNVFGAVIKKIKVFGKEVEEVEWEPIKSSPTGIVQIENHTLRLYFNDETGKLEGIEILESTTPTEKLPEEQKVDYNKWTVKELKELCKTHEIKVPSSFRKAQIIELLEKSNIKNNES